MKHSAPSRYYSIPKKFICDRCGRPFETLIPGETTCIQCQIKPAPSLKPAEVPMAQNCKDKVCTDCHNPFKPTSNVQKRCPPCIEKHKKGLWKKYRRQPAGVSAAEKLTPATKSIPTGFFATDKDIGIASLAKRLLQLTGVRLLQFTVDGIKISLEKI